MTRTTKISNACDVNMQNAKDLNTFKMKIHCVDLQKRRVRVKFTHITRFTTQIDTQFFLKKKKKLKQSVLTLRIKFPIGSPFKLLSKII